MIYKHKWLLLFSFLTGLVILLLPDQAPPVFQLNKEHGPSIPDLAGLLLMLISWIISTILAANYWSDLKNKFGNRVLFLLVLIYCFSLGGIVAGLNLSIEWTLWVSVMTATIINILFIIAAVKVAASKHKHANRRQDILTFIY